MTKKKSKLLRLLKMRLVYDVARGDMLSKSTGYAEDHIRILVVMLLHLVLAPLWSGEGRLRKRNNRGKKKREENTIGVNVACAGIS